MSNLQADSAGNAERPSDTPVELTGRCACGAVKLRAKVPKTFGVCHCRTCRRWTSSIWMGVRSIEPPHITGPVKIWKSSGFADRAFCAECGASIWHRPKLAKGPTLALGLFDDQTGWTMNKQIFIEEQPDHYGFGGRGTGFTGWGALWALLSGRMPK